MNDASAMTAGVLRVLAEFLNGLPEDQIADLSAGRAQLGLIPFGATAPVLVGGPKATTSRRSAASTVNAEAILAKLGAATSREEGRDILGSLSAPDLRVVGAAAGLTGISKTPKPDLVGQIVAVMIGGRMSFAAMNGL